MAAPRSAPRTLYALIRAAEAKMAARRRIHYGHGMGSAGEEALFLVTEALGVPGGFTGEFPDRPVTAREAALAMAAVDERISTRRPAAYIVNKMYLQGLPFYVDERVIVPRSFIAEILAGGFLPAGRPLDILDLCTGSGCLAILAARLFPKARVDAVELSEGAADVAARNIAAHKMGRRVRLLRGDLFAPCGKRKYDLIITNPPYVAPRSMRALPPEYRHEPRMALGGGGKDGLSVVRRIMAEAPAFLKEGGGMLCEIGGGRRALERAFPEISFLWLDTENSRGEVFWLEKEDFAGGRIAPRRAGFARSGKIDRKGARR